MRWMSNPAVQPMTTGDLPLIFSRPRRHTRLPVNITCWPASHPRSGWSFAVILAGSFLPQLQANFAPALLALVVTFIAPVGFFFAIAHMIARSQEMRVLTQSMSEVAIRLSEPDGVARESLVTVGQAIRREVAAMGDGVERALARAAELEVLVQNGVAALERAYNDNEVRIRGLLDDLAAQRTA